MSTITAASFTAAQRIARKAADQYFAALAAEIPFDNAPGEVNLISAVCDVQAALLGSGKTDEDTREDAALRAGYLLGVEIGRRMGGR